MYIYVCVYECGNPRICVLKFLEFEIQVENISVFCLFFFCFVLSLEVSYLPAGQTAYYKHR